MKRVYLFLMIVFVFISVNAQIPMPQSEYKLTGDNGTFKVNENNGALLSGPPNAMKPLTLFSRAGIQFYSNSPVPFPASLPIFELGANSELRMLFGSLSLKSGRNNSLLFNANSLNELRIGGQSGIAFWGDGNADNNDAPNVKINQDGSMWTQTLNPLMGKLTIKEGRNGDPTMKVTASKWLRIGSNDGIGLWAGSDPDANDVPTVLLSSTGNLSIGMSQGVAPYKLNVGGAVYTENGGVKTYLGKDSDKDDAWIGTKSNNGLYLGTNNLSSFYIDADKHNTYIGLIDTDVAKIRTELKDKYKLFVGKGILSEDYSISPKSSWSDFVFSKNYKLKAISEVERFISKNNHLPDVPSAQQVAEEGYSQHDMNKILLQKIEELTLYTIQQQKEIELLKNQLNESKR